MASLEQGVERVRGRMGIKSREERVREEKAEEERRKEVLRGRIRVIMARAEDEVKVEVRRNKAAKTKVKEERPAGSQVVGWKEAAKESGEEKKWV